MLDIRELKSGQFYSTNNPVFPLAYVLKITFEEQIQKKPKFPELEDFDYVVIRFLSKWNINHNSEMYLGSFGHLPKNKKLKLLINLPLNYNETYQTVFVEYEGTKFDLELSCAAVYTADRIHSQANPYKFDYKLSIGKRSGLYTPDIALPDEGTDKAQELIFMFTELIGFSEFVYFRHYSPGMYLNGQTTTDGFDFYFKDSSLYNLVKLSIKPN